MAKKNTIDILLKKFPPSEYALMAEVRDAAGFGASRSADYLIMGLWPSRGLDMIGIERKTYRNDWLGELKKPEKAENIYQYCDRWYLLTDNENVAKIEEIPQMWGWMHINESGKIILYKEAPKLTPAPISKSFLACILKRAACKKGWITEISIQDKIESAKQDGINQRDHRAKNTLEAFKILETNVKEFEETTGIKINNLRWGATGKQIGEAVKFILDGGIESLKQKISQIKNLTGSVTKSIEDYEKLNT